MRAVHIIGMSHMMPVLKACSPLEEDHHRHFGNGNPPRFIDWPTVPDCFPAPVRVASLYIGHTSPFWGPVMASWDPRAGLACADGFRQLLESMEIEEGRTPVFVFMNGEEHIHMSRRQHGTPHDFFVPERPDLEIRPNRQVLPISVIENQAQQFLAPAKASFLAIRILSKGANIFNVLCPPPVLGSSLPASAPEISADGDTNDCIRLKHYLTYTRLLKGFVEPLGIRTIEPPTETLTRDGFLRPEYTGDPVHGNKDYGHQVLAQLRATLSL